MSSTAATIVDALAAAPQDRAFVTMWHEEDEIESLTFGEFAHQVDIQAAGLHGHGLRAGDTIILILPQGMALMACFLAAMRLGAIPSILAYPNERVDPAKYRSGLAGVARVLTGSMLVCDRGFPASLLAALSSAGELRIVTPSAESNPPARPAPADAVDPAAIAFVQHSSGTTGLQKGVALTHAQVLRQLGELAAAIDLRQDDRIYSWLPLYHDMGLIASFLLPLVSHTPVVMQSPTAWAMRPATMLSLIGEYRCSLCWVPNFALQFLARRVRARDRERLDLSPLRMLINCSEPVRAQSLDEFRAAFTPHGLNPGVLHTSYALAENVFAATQSTAGGPVEIAVDAERLSREGVAVRSGAAATPVVRLVSSGQVLAGTRLRIISAEGRTVPDGTVGEILLQGECLFSGYYHRPDLTGTAVRDGWLHTGDLGFLLDGELFVTGRRSDVIIVAGKNIYPADLEEIASRHPAVRDGRVVAFGMVNADLATEDVVIVAELEAGFDPGSSEAVAATIRAAILDELGVAVRDVHLKPAHWIVKSTSGKPARSATRAKLQTQSPPVHPDSAHG